MHIINSIEKISRIAAFCTILVKFSLNKQPRHNNFNESPYPPQLKSTINPLGKQTACLTNHLDTYSIFSISRPTNRTPLFAASLYSKEWFRKHEFTTSSRVNFSITRYRELSTSHLINFWTSLYLNFFHFQSCSSDATKVTRLVQCRQHSRVLFLFENPTSKLTSYGVPVQTAIKDSLQAEFIFKISSTLSCQPGHVQ